MAGASAALRLRGGRGRHASPQPPARGEGAAGAARAGEPPRGNYDSRQRPARPKGEAPVARRRAGWAASEGARWGGCFRPRGCEHHAGGLAGLARSCRRRRCSCSHRGGREAPRARLGRSGRGGAAAAPSWRRSGLGEGRTPGSQSGGGAAGGGEAGGPGCPPHPSAERAAPLQPLQTFGSPANLPGAGRIPGRERRISPPRPCALSFGGVRGLWPGPGCQLSLARVLAAPTPPGPGWAC